MICYGHGHYFAYFRRIFLKIGFLSGVDFVNINAQAQRIQREELQPDTEWIQYNDSTLRFVQDNWSGILQECIEYKVFPTVLFFEKLASVEDDAEYAQRKEFSQVSRELSRLVNQAQTVEREERQNTDFSAADIEEQFRIQKQLQ